ncbi:hypothetical protein F8154_03170 [Alkaliphilus pronyensis]|uniref:Exo-alpha-sialidase n=2 Tax=Alkaliphilus pronyensis TaxID=1482732 RepID=A0A6I0FG02_9FIRM|nr:hypothetical protein F8154_03170 [Alkaliphilus pronyensis]
MEFLLCSSNNDLFNIYMDDKNQIRCLSSTKNKWTDSHLITQDTSHSFAATIDPKDNIHLFNTEDKNRINYYIYKKKKWLQKASLSLSLKEEKLLYPYCIYHDSYTYLFFYQKELQKNICRLKVIKFEKNKAVEATVLSVDFQGFVNPFKVFSIDKSIYVLFTSLVENKEEIFLVKLNEATKEWEKPFKITDTSVNKLYLDGVIDNTNSLHITWCNYDKDQLSVNYTKLDLKENKILIEPKQLSENKLNCSYPHILFYNDVAFVIWYQYNHLVKCTSQDYGENWSSVKIIEKSKLVNFKRYKFVTNNNMNRIIGDSFYGTLYPTIQFLGLGGDIDDEISTS